MVLTFAAVALAATVLTVVVGATVLVVAPSPFAAVALVVRAVLPARLGYHTVPSATPWPHQTFDTTVVNLRASSDEGDFLRLDSDKG